MKITEDEKKRTTFGDLLVGDAFKCEGSYYMKGFKDNENCAVELSVGGIYKMLDNVYVEPVNAELHIK